MTQLVQALVDLKNAAVRPYYLARMAYPIWHGVLNREAVARYAARPPQLDAVQERLAGELRRHGIARTSLAELFPDRPDLLGVLQARAQVLRTSASANSKKPFLVSLFERVPRIDPSDPFCSLALSSRVVDTVNAYLGMWSKFFAMALDVTLPVPAGEPATSSQRWHRDPEDRRLCKMFVYLNDVDATSGPFMYARGSQDGGPHRRAFPQRPPRGYYPPEGAVEARIPAQDILACTGPAGSVIFADTSGLHKGGYATGKERIMLTVGFFTNASPRGIFYRPPEDASMIASLPPAVAYAVTGKRLGEGLGY